MSEANPRGASRWLRYPRQLGSGAYRLDARSGPARSRRSDTAGGAPGLRGVPATALRSLRSQLLPALGTSRARYPRPRRGDRDDLVAFSEVGASPATAPSVSGKED